MVVVVAMVMVVVMVVVVVVVVLVLQPPPRRGLTNVRSHPSKIHPRPGVRRGCSLGERG